MEGIVAEIRGLTISGPADSALRRTLVDNVSLTVAAGECVALVGESGSGKTLVTRSLVGLIPGELRVEMPSAGQDLLLGGESVKGLTEKQWREIRGNRVGLVSQDALLSLDPLRRIGKEVEESLVVHGARGGASLNRTERRALALKTLRDVRMPDPEIRRRAYPHELSGGLRQRALIAQAIVGGPSLLIADEPTTALDSTVQAHILDLLLELKAQGMGILLVSHDLGLVQRIADRALVMRAGVVVEEGRPRDLVRDPQHEYTRMLVAAIPSSKAPAMPVVPASLAESRLTAVGLTKSYRGAGVPAVDDVSFTLEPGTTLGVVGESGSGKSTIARLVMGIEAPDSGEVRLDGQPWSGVPERRRRARRRSIQLIHQDPYSALNPRVTVGRSVAEALAHLPAVARRGRVSELFGRVGLDLELARQRPGQLSGGQRQRVAIARALAAEPDVLVCDEAVSALDVSVQADILTLLHGIQQGTGLAMLFISHDLAVVREMSHRILVMEGGRVVEEGETEQVLTQPRTAFTRELVAHSTSL